MTRTYDPQAFAKRINYAMARSRYKTNVALSKALSVREATVSNWRNARGKEEPKQENLRELPFLLRDEMTGAELNVNWLLYGEEPMYRPVEVSPQARGGDGALRAIEGEAIRRGLETTEPEAQESSESTPKRRKRANEK